MKIYNTSGEELKERPDYTKGRLLQDPDDPEKLIYSPWDEVLLREEENPNAVQSISEGERISALEESQEEQNQVLDTLLMSKEATNG